MVFWIWLLSVRIRLRLIHAVAWIRSVLLFVVDEYCIVPISCNSYCNQDTALLHLHKDFPHSIPAESSTTTTTTLTLPNPANNSLVSISVIFSFQEYYINEIKHHMTACGI